MASNAAKECQICQDEYNEAERCPRVLPCSHTLCSECLQNLIVRNKKTCPFCLSKFTAMSPRDIGVNTSLVDLLKLVKEMEMGAHNPHENTVATKSNRMHDLKRETEEAIDNLLGSFKKSDDEIDKQLLINKELVTYFSEAKDTITNEIQPCIDEVRTQNVSRASYLEKHSRRLNNQKMTNEETRNVIIEVKTKLKSAKTFTQVGTAADEVENIKTEAESSLQNFMDQLSKDQKTHLVLEKVAKSTTHEVDKLKEMVKSIKKDELSFIPKLQQMKISKDLMIQTNVLQSVTIEDLRSRSGPVIELIEQERIFAVHDLEGHRRYAKISLQERNKICLHCLKEQIIPSNAYILQHRDVLNLLDVSSRLVFLQLSIEEKTVGTLFIRLSPDSKRAQQFALLCSGEKAVSFVNSKIIRVFFKGTIAEGIWMGDYENMDGAGGRGLVPEVLEEEGRVFRRFQLAGTVQGISRYVGDKKAAQYVIYTHENLITERDYCFGLVEEGLDILRNLIRGYNDITKVFVSDAGLVLPI